jgi:hypothetical protein
MIQAMPHRQAQEQAPHAFQKHPKEEGGAGRNAHNEKRDTETHAANVETASQGNHSEDDKRKEMKDTLSYRQVDAYQLKDDANIGK